MNLLPFIWEWNIGQKFCVLHSLQNVEKAWQLSKGISCAQDFPSNASFFMHPDHPRYKLLADNLSNVNRALVVSGKLKEFIETWHLPGVEYLPISVYDHKKRLASN